MFYPVSLCGGPAHPDFCGPGWWHDMDIILDEAEKRNMTVWILDDKHFPTGYANGLIEKCYPERKKVYINYSSADIFGAKRELTLNVKEMLKPLTRFWEIGKPCDQEEREKNEFLALIALKFCHGHVFEEETIDLSDTFDGVNATFTLPEGQWKVYAIYRTRTDGGDEAYINLIDEKSARTQLEGVYEEHYKKYGEKFGTVIAGFFSDEPQFGNISGFAKDAVIGRKEMPLPWSDELEQMLTEKYGTEYRRFLPFLWADSDRMQKCPRIRYDYPDFRDEKTTGKLRPISEDEPDFSGIIRYKKKFEINAVPVSAEISFEYVYEAMTLWVNGEKAGICFRPPYKMEIGNLLRAGENEICAEVATTPVREQGKYPQTPFKTSHIALEPAGMYGEVKLLF